MRERPHIVIVSGATLLDQGEYRSRLERLGTVDVVAAWGREVDDWSVAAKALGGCTVVVAGPEPYPDELLSRLDGLKLIARSGVGVDGIDLRAAERLGIRIATTPHANVRAVAQHTLTLALSVLHRIPKLDACVRGGQWRPLAPLRFRELGDLNIGIVGFGRIGRESARLFAALGATVGAYDPHVDIDGDPRVRAFDDKSELAAWCDVLSLHVPSTADSRRMIGGDVLRRMRPGSILVNTSRGDIVDPAALGEFLAMGGQAAMDVFDVEPPNGTDPALVSSETVLTPHVAAFSIQAARRVTEMILDEIERTM